MKRSSVLVALIVFVFSLPVFAGERQEKIVAFAGGATVTPASGVSIPLKKVGEWTPDCKNFEYFWLLDVGPYGEIHKYPFTVQSVQCLVYNSAPSTPAIRHETFS